MAETDASADILHGFLARMGLAHALSVTGEVEEGRRHCEVAVELATEIGPFTQPWAYAGLAHVGLAAGDLALADRANDAVWRRFSIQPELLMVNFNPMAQAALVREDLTTARLWADKAVSGTVGWFHANALITRTRVAIAEGDLELGERDIHEALACAAEVEGYQIVPDALDVLAEVAVMRGDHREAARVLGASEAIRDQMGMVRLAIFEPALAVSVARIRDALEESDYQAARLEGAALSVDEAIAYAQRGRGERRRPSTGWDSLTPTELEVVRLVAEGLGNKDIAARLFISHRTVQTHLTHVYTKLGITSRVALAQEAARHV
jgi:DNA-binding CsgD family transcriptional regulator